MKNKFERFSMFRELIEIKVATVPLIPYRKYSTDADTAALEQKLLTAQAAAAHIRQRKENEKTARIAQRQREFIENHMMMQRMIESCEDDTIN